MAAVQKGHEGRVSANKKKTHALGRMQLVARAGEKVDGRIVQTHGHLAGGLDRIGMEENAALPGHHRHLFHRKEHAGFVVGPGYDKIIGAFSIERSRKFMENINWYPGHMKKTWELIKENLKLVDAAVEIRDARIPRSSENPIIDQLTQSKPRVVVLNKADLADKKETQQWIKHMERSNSLYLGSEYIFVSDSKADTNLLFLSTIGTFSSSLSAGFIDRSQ